MKAKNPFYFLGLTILSFTIMMENLMQSSKLFHSQNVQNWTKFKKALN